MLMRSTATATAMTLALGAAALGALAGCGPAGPANGQERGPNVVAALYPLQFAAERVGGDAVRVTTLTRPGAEPHDLELELGQVAEIGEADLVIYLSGLQPTVDDAVAQQNPDRAFDVATVQPLLEAADAGHDHDGDGHAEERPESTQPGGVRDPHVWLDPTRLATIADRLAERLGQVDRARAADYTARARTLRAELETLDREYANELADCRRREIVTSHTAFTYLAARYDLEQIGITGLTPEAEPSAQRLIEATAEAREHGATTIYFETLVSPAVAETIAREIGAKTAVLDPLEGLQPGATGDYFSVMRANLAALTAGLDCS